MKAGSEKLLIVRCAELLGMLSFTDTMSQKRRLTQTEMSQMIKSHWEILKTNTEQKLQS